MFFYSGAGSHGGVSCAIAVAFLCYLPMTFSLGGFGVLIYTLDKVEKEVSNKKAVY